MFEYTICKKLINHENHLDLDKVHTQQTFSKIDINDIQGSDLKLDIFKLEKDDWERVKKEGKILKSFTVITTIEVEYIPDVN